MSKHSESCWGGRLQPIIYCVPRIVDYEGQPQLTHRNTNFSWCDTQSLKLGSLNKEYVPLGKLPTCWLQQHRCFMQWCLPKFSQLVLLLHRQILPLLTSSFYVHGIGQEARKLVLLFSVFPVCFLISSCFLVLKKYHLSFHLLPIKFLNCFSLLFKLEIQPGSGHYNEALT